PPGDAREGGGDARPAVRRAARARRRRGLAARRVRARGDAVRPGRRAGRPARGVAAASRGPAGGVGGDVIGRALHARRAGALPAAAERFAAGHGWAGLDAARVLEMPSVFAGPAGRVAETMQARRERFGFSYYVVSDGDMEAFAPVVERLSGS